MSLRLGLSFTPLLVGDAERTGYDYLITNDADWTTVFANSDATLNGKIVQVLSTASLVSKTLTSRVFAGGLTIRGGKRSVKPVLAKLIMNGCSGITFQDIHFGGSAVDNQDNVVKSTTTSNVTTVFDYCKFAGPAWDVNGDYSVTTPNGLDGDVFYGIASGSAGSEWDGLTITNNDFEYLNSAIKLTCKNGPVVITNNTIYGVYHDYISLGQALASQVSSWDVSWNKMSGNCGRSADAGNPHTDALQLNGASNLDWKNFRAEGNIVVTGNARGDLQGIPFAENFDAGLGLLTKFFIGYNITIMPDVLGAVGNRGLTIESGAEGFVYKNIAVRARPPAGTGTVGMFLGPYVAAAGDVLVKDNIAESFALGLSSNGGNTAVTNTLGAYQAQFTGPTFDPQTVSEALIKYATAGSTGVDYTARTVDRTLEHPGAFFVSMPDQALSSVSTSAGTYIKAGPATMAYSCAAGLEAQYADDAAFTVNASAWGTSGTVARGKYIRVRHTNAGANATSTTKILTLNGFAISFTSTTVSTPFAGTVFDGVNDHLSRAGVLLGSADSGQFLFVHKWKSAGRPTLTSINLFRSSSTRFTINPTTSGLIRVTARNSAGTVVLTFDIAPGGTWDTAGNDVELFISVDMSQPTPALGVKAYVNGVDKTPASFGTYTQNATINFAQNTTWQLAVGDGTNKYAETHYLTVLKPGVTPDIADPNVRDQYSLDFIAPSSALIAIYGNAATLNGGTGNQGTGGAFTMTGAVVDA